MLVFSKLSTEPILIAKQNKKEHAYSFLLAASPNSVTDKCVP